MDSPTPLDSALVIERLGGTSEVARLCECSPQAVSQWFGPDPVTQLPRHIPNPRLLFLKAIRPDVFKQLAEEAAAEQKGGESGQSPAGLQDDEDSDEILPPEPAVRERDRRDPNHPTRRVSARSRAEAARLQADNAAKGVL